uniref:Phosphoadenosine phosphosulphate reductase domain-containing protein n=1 Tax=Aplanochytrium stocchinoi TaxID=215587 RepID=A0A7S3PF43_9STRA|mmetsp:Transcript_20327/g.24674  ORF Transcript_20327/g.24674 Transcript_20327/m.24674 type:complete len:529 (-) Transcript_20327:99-1685(-)
MVSTRFSSRLGLFLKAEALRQSSQNVLPRIRSRQLSTISKSDERTKPSLSNLNLRPMSSSTNFATVPKQYQAAAAAATVSPLSFPADDLPSILTELNDRVHDIVTDPLAVMRFTVEEFEGRVAMSTSFGIQSAVLLHIATQVLPDIPVVWVDTGYLPKETYEYAEQLKEVLNLNLIVKSNQEWSPARMEAIHGKLWESDTVEGHTLYGRMRKAEPLNEGLDSIRPNPKVLLSGLRASQTKARANMPVIGYQNSRFKVLPLLKMTDEDVEKYMDMYDLPAHPLTSKGYVTVGDWHSSRPVGEGEDARNTRFGGKFEECGLHVDEHEPVKQAEEEKPEDNIHQLESSKKTGVDALETTMAHAETDTAVIMIKKVMEDGSYCRKCNDVQGKIESDGIADWIGYTGYADVTDAQSEGARLAKHFGIGTAPFFLVRSLEEQKKGEEWKVVRSYLQLRKMLEKAEATVEESRDNVGESKDSEEMLKAQKHLEELKIHVDRLERELKQAQTKVSETKQFFVKKFQGQHPEADKLF